MEKRMNTGGMLLVLVVLVVAFIVGHVILSSNRNQKAMEESARRVTLTQLMEQNNTLNSDLKLVETKEYIVSSAIENYSYMSKDDIRFTFTNPEALYAYTEAELQILMDEIGN